MADREPPRDPLAGLRAMAEVQRAGIEAATTVVERLLELGRLGTRGPFPFPLPPDPRVGSNGDAPSVDADSGRDVRRLRGDAERMLELWGEWMRLLLDAAADSAEVGLGRSDGAPDHLSLGPTEPGSSVAGRTWLHVLDGPPTAPATLTATAFTSHDGSVIEAGVMSFEPSVLDTFSLRSSEEVIVTVDVPERTPAGTYHGHILATGLPELGLAVRIEVSA